MLINFQVLTKDSKVLHCNALVVNSLNVLVVNELQSLENVENNQRRENIHYDEVVGKHVLVIELACEVVEDEIASTPVNENKLV